MGFDVCDFPIMRRDLLCTFQNIQCSFEPPSQTQGLADLFQKFWVMFINNMALLEIFETLIDPTLAAHDLPLQHQRIRVIDTAGILPGVQHPQTFIVLSSRIKPE